ncbi:hypothetical protein MAP00_002253 [Monascus purpureus]|nr:hypothetical protein MAP00_002253 [Monascus purpureus]
MLDWSFSHFFLIIATIPCLYVSLSLYHSNSTTIRLSKCLLPQLKVSMFFFIFVHATTRKEANPKKKKRNEGGTEESLLAVDAYIYRTKLDFASDIADAHIDANLSLFDNEPLFIKTSVRFWILSRLLIF